MHLYGMRKSLLVLLLSCLAGTWAIAQQSPATPPAKELTPAEQRQKEKIEREIQRERQIRAEWLQKQREYEAKQAEKERQRQAKKAGKAQMIPTPVAPDKEVTPPAAVPAPVVKEPAPQTEAEPTKVEKAEKPKKVKAEKPKKEEVALPNEEKVEKPKKEKVVKPKKEKPPKETPKTESVTEPTPIPVTPPAKVGPSPAERPAKAERPPRVKRERPVQTLDSAALRSIGYVDPTVGRPVREFLPKGHLFEPILLDPLESQTYGSVYPAYWTDGKQYAGSIIPFAFGFAKPFYRHTTAPGKAEEWVLDLASFTQFEAYHDAQANVARRRIINTDYKISFIYNIRRGENNYRIRLYHLSSHLGDDYIFRNQITAPTPNAVNYELLDFTYSRVYHNWRLYGGAGIVLRNAEERKPVSAQFGAFYKKPSTHAARLVGGVDVKFWQQTNFRPGIHGGIGVEVGRTQNNLTFLLEGYSGFRPYSQYEDQQTAWIGVGLYLNPF